MTFGGFFPEIMHTLEFKLRNVHGQLHGLQVVAREKVFNRKRNYIRCMLITNIPW
jgi:hypothetical protein